MRTTFGGVSAGSLATRLDVYGREQRIRIRGDGLTMLPETCEVCANRVINHRASLLEIASVGHTARKRRNSSRKPTLWLWTEVDMESPHTARHEHERTLRKTISARMPLVMFPT